MALIKQIKSKEQQPTYWHLFQLRFDYPANNFIVDFNGYTNLQSRTKNFENDPDYVPLVTKSHKVSRSTANLIAEIIYLDAKKTQFSGATDEMTTFIPEDPDAQANPEAEGLIQTAFSSIKKLFA